MQTLTTPTASTMPQPSSVELQRTHHALEMLADQAYDDIVALAAELCGTPYASVVLADTTHLWFKASVGLRVQSGVFPRARSFADAALQRPDQVTQIEDAQLDSRFTTHPVVTGELRIRFFAGAPIHDVNGAPLGVTCVFDTQPRSLSGTQIAHLSRLSRQITRLLELRRQGEHQLQQVRTHNEYLHALSAGAADLKSVVDSHYVYRRVNEAYLQYWQKQRDDIEGRAVADLLGQELFETTVKPLLDRALNGECVAYEATFDFPGVGPRHARVTYLPAYGVDQKIMGVVVRTEDIDELRRTESSLRQSVQMVEDKNIALQRFIQILSHDLREPVNTILNFTSLLREVVGELPQALRYADFVYGGGVRLRTLLDDLMSYVSVERHTVGSRLVSLNEVFDDVKLDLYDALTRARAQLTADSLPLVTGEHSLLRLLLQNLVTNAVKFVAPDTQPAVHVSAVQHHDACELVVSDNGIGILEEDREAVFDLFKRLHTRRQYAGTGLGLATCRRVAELHGGRVWVTPNPSGGSRFHVWLPLQPRAERNVAMHR